MSEALSTWVGPTALRARSLAFAPPRAHVELVPALVGALLHAGRRSEAATALSEALARIERPHQLLLLAPAAIALIGSERERLVLLRDLLTTHAQRGAGIS